MPKTLTGLGYTRRDDTYNRVLKTFLNGSVTPLAGHFNAEIMQQLASGQVNAIVTVNPATGVSFFQCGKSLCGGGDECSN